MQIKPTGIRGCYEIDYSRFSDARGHFVKTFHRDWFAEREMHGDIAEQYYSTSYAGVLRGLHFQLPPHDHAKLVYCIDGWVLDVAVDLRVGSPTYGQSVEVELAAARANAVWLPSGLAHGFYTRSEIATLVYNVTSVHAPDHDSGVHWDSAGIAWPDAAPTVSERDSALPRLAEFESPFIYRSA